MDTVLCCANTNCTRYPSESCAGCYRVHYCSVACQNRDWPMHADECRRDGGGTPTHLGATARVATRTAAHAVGAGEEELVDEMLDAVSDRRHAAAMLDADDDALVWSSARADVPTHSSTLVYELVFDDASSTHASSVGASDVAVLRWLDHGDSALSVANDAQQACEQRAATSGDATTSTTTPLGQTPVVAVSTSSDATEHAQNNTTTSTTATHDVFYENVGELVYNAYTGCYVDSIGMPVFNIDTRSFNMDTAPLHGTRLRLVTRLGAPPHVMMN